MIRKLFNNLLCFPSYWEVEKIEHDIETDEVDIYIKFNIQIYKEEYSDIYIGLQE